MGYTYAQPARGCDFVGIAPQYASALGKNSNCQTPVCDARIGISAAHAEPGGSPLLIMFGAILGWLGINSSCFVLRYGVVWVLLILNCLTEVRRASVMGLDAVTAEPSQA